MKFLIDEDVPLKILKYLVQSGHDARRVKSSLKDSEIARQAKEERRIIITLDKNFTNAALYPPSEFNIIRIQIHPPDAEAIIKAFQKLLRSLTSKELKGLIILEASGHIRVT